MCESINTMTTTPISTPAAIAATRLIAECHLFEFQDECAEAIVQAACDAAAAMAVAQARAGWEREKEEKQADGL